eukprot:TRINITY_DN50041_c0_g1_i1.p1 TRINITY_DN50041_c0_g1~~TRINITY_DN50041_c0_g1_i1.p1  ORF type:complete len:339 (-),score=63.51 TRINITY_DN50041_c0_g1_i1:91-993(-)
MGPVGFEATRRGDATNDTAEKSFWFAGNASVLIQQSATDYYEENDCVMVAVQDPKGNRIKRRTKILRVCDPASVSGEKAAGGDRCEPCSEEDMQVNKCMYYVHYVLCTDNQFEVIEPNKILKYMEDEEEPGVKPFNPNTCTSEENGAQNQVGEKDASQVPEEEEARQDEEEAQPEKQPDRVVKDATIGASNGGEALADDDVQQDKALCCFCINGDSVVSLKSGKSWFSASGSCNKNFEKKKRTKCPALKTLPFTKGDARRSRAMMETSSVNKTSAIIHMCDEKVKQPDNDDDEDDEDDEE